MDFQLETDFSNINQNIFHASLGFINITSGKMMLLILVMTCSSWIDWSIACSIFSIQSARNWMIIFHWVNDCKPQMVPGLTVVVMFKLRLEHSRFSLVIWLIVQISNYYNYVTETPSGVLWTLAPWHFQMYGPGTFLFSVLNTRDMSVDIRDPGSSKSVICFDLMVIYLSKCRWFRCVKCGILYIKLTFAVH